MTESVHKLFAPLALAAILTYVNTFDLDFFATPVRILNSFVSDNITTTLPAISYLQCLSMCNMDPNCHGVFYHPADEVCMLTQHKHYTTSGLQSYAGMENYQYLASTCSEWLLIGQVNTSGYQLIDPDGRQAGFEPVTIWCDVTTEPGKAVTVLNHDHEQRTHVEGYEDCGSYTINLTYDVGLEMVKAIVDISSECKQYIKYECHNAVVHTVATGDPCVIWKNRYLQDSSYFTGSGSYPKYCDCSQTNTCSHSSGCNCNYNDNAWRYDDGYVTNKNDLPITGFQTGDTGGRDNVREHSYHTIGPLLCW